MPDGAVLAVDRIHLDVTVFIAQGPVRGFKIGIGNARFFKRRMIRPIACGSGRVIRVLAILGLQVIAVAGGPSQGPVPDLALAAKIAIRYPD
jgi:hypothetical protein